MTNHEREIVLIANQLWNAGEALSDGKCDPAMQMTLSKQLKAHAAALQELPPF